MTQLRKDTPRFIPECTNLFKQLLECGGKATLNGGKLLSPTISCFLNILDEVSVSQFEGWYGLGSTSPTQRWSKALDSKANVGEMLRLLSIDHLVSHGDDVVVFVFGNRIGNMLGAASDENLSVRKL